MKKVRMKLNLIEISAETNIHACVIIHSLLWYWNAVVWK